MLALNDYLGKRFCDVTRQSLERKRARGNIPSWSLGFETRYAVSTHDIISCNQIVFDAALHAT
jgi:hypothetical protein